MPNNLQISTAIPLSKKTPNTKESLVKVMTGNTREHIVITEKQFNSEKTNNFPSEMHYNNMPTSNPKTLTNNGEKDLLNKKKSAKVRTIDLVNASKVTLDSDILNKQIKYKKIINLNPNDNYLGENKGNIDNSNNRIKDKSSKISKNMHGFMPQYN